MARVLSVNGVQGKCIVANEGPRRSSVFATCNNCSIIDCISFFKSCLVKEMENHWEPKIKLK